MTEVGPLAQSGQTLVYQSSNAVYHWTAEIDLAAWRLRLTRRWFGRWSRTVVDCSLGDCVSVGTVEYNTDGHISYGTYIKLSDGNWHAIPLKGSSFDEASKVVRQVAAATKIPRLDIKYS